MDEKVTGMDESAEPVQERGKPNYEPPRIVTYTSEELLEQIGPAMACSPSPCATAP
jgi:hypothetical protein